MAAMKATWIQFEETLKKSINKMFKEAFEFTDLGEMSEKDVIQMNECIRLYRASRKYMEDLCDVYDNDVAKLREEMAGIKGKQNEILEILEEIRGKQLPSIKG